MLCSLFRRQTPPTYTHPTIDSASRILCNCANCEFYVFRTNPRERAKRSTIVVTSRRTLTRTARPPTAMTRDQTIATGIGTEKPPQRTRKLSTAVHLHLRLIIYHSPLLLSILTATPPFRRNVRGKKSPPPPPPKKRKRTRTVTEITAARAVRDRVTATIPSNK